LIYPEKRHSVCVLVADNYSVNVYFLLTKETEYL